MAVGTTTQLTKDWVQLTVDAEAFCIQNIGNGMAIIKFSATIPADDAQGHEIKRGNQVASIMYGTGVTWGRAIANTQVEVTK